MAEITKNFAGSVSVTQEDARNDMEVHWFRSTIFQIIVVGGVFFCVSIACFTIMVKTCLTGFLPSRPRYVSCFAVILVYRVHRDW